MFSIKNKLTMAFVTLKKVFENFCTDVILVAESGKLLESYFCFLMTA